MRIREARERQNLQQKELAAKLRIAQNTLSQYETGKREPDLETLKRIADTLGTTTDYLLDREVSRDTKKEPTPVSESGPSLYPPEYDLLSPADKELVDNMIRSLARKK